MKKKAWILIGTLVMLAILFVPIPTGTCQDGGTRVYTALTYKIVQWHRIYPGGVFDETRVYFGSDKNKSIDELFVLENIQQTHTFTAKVLERNDHSILVEPLLGEDELRSSDKISFSTKGLPDIGAQVGSYVEITYDGLIMESYPAQINASGWKLIEDPCTLIPAAKPVIYLYPEETTEVTVKLFLDGWLTCTYPAYNSGWTVTAAPDGTLTDERGQIYSYLYWEGKAYGKFDLTRGFCVKGEDTAAFLEQALAKLGLNRREANEFIVYWLPLMEDNPYNIIAFQADDYKEYAKLEVTPAPDTVIRVFMTWQASDEYVDLEPQALTAPERIGFTLVEWGGTEVKKR